VPQTIEQLDKIAEHFATPGSQTLKSPVGYLPDSRRLWAWAPVFGGSFYDQPTQRATIDTNGNRAALNWMRTYQSRYGADNLASFRQADQSLPGKTFPLLPLGSNGDTDTVGRYVTMMDGQWRVRDIVAFQNQRQRSGKPVPKFGVCSLPFRDADGNGVPDQGGRKNAGWVNGNFFVVPSGARCPRGAWEFAKFWIGAKDPQQAAQWYVDGGWVPATKQVAAAESFENYLDATPLFKTFVELAGSENQFPIPAVSGAAAFKREVESLAWDTLMVPMDDRQLENRMQQCQREVDNYLGGDH
jgi:multiple sugar transport system substrate-binding protein